MTKIIKEEFIAETFAMYDLNSYQKTCISKVVDGCIDLITYETGSKGLRGPDINTLAGLIKGHIINILNVLDVGEDNGKRRPKKIKN
tara:strand:- start:6696 stop:6956 length:261 start_codon:yes stop_codon:yes gene_type:complete